MAFWKQPWQYGYHRSLRIFGHGIFHGESWRYLFKHFSVDANSKARRRTPSPIVLGDSSDDEAAKPINKDALEKPDDEENCLSLPRGKKVKNHLKKKMSERTFVSAAAAATTAEAPAASSVSTASTSAATNSVVSAVQVRELVTAEINEMKKTWRNCIHENVNTRRPQSGWQATDGPSNRQSSPISNPCLQKFCWLTRRREYLNVSIFWMVWSHWRFQSNKDQRLRVTRSQGLGLDSIF